MRATPKPCLTRSRITDPSPLGLGVDPPAFIVRSDPTQPAARPSSQCKPMRLSDSTHVQLKFQDATQPPVYLVQQTARNTTNLDVQV